MTKYYTKTIQRNETVIVIVSSPSGHVQYVDRDLKSHQGEVIREVRLGEVKEAVVESYRELTVVEMAILHNTHPHIDPMSNEYGKPTAAPPDEEDI